MHAYLIISSSEKSIAEKVSEIAGSDTRIINYSIEKIDDTKELIRRTNIALDETVYVLPAFDNASTEAQNAFLKRLEEPQENLKFVLTAKKEDLVLPTIISRCQVIRLAGKAEASAEEISSALKFLDSDVQEKLSVVSKITKREEAVEFLESLISGAHNARRLRELKHIDIALSRISQNANPTLQLTHLVLSI